MTDTEPILIDGSFGEGGGQIIRSSLALSIATGKPFHVTNIRANRAKPGLKNQHLTGVRAAAEVGMAETTGAELNSQELTFSPSGLKTGRFDFSIGTAGSTMLVLQTVLPVLITADGPSEIHLEGGTHASMAPPLEFIEKTFLPIINRMGAKVTLKLERPGFYPMGGGRLQVNITPCEKLDWLDISKRGRIESTHAYAMVSNLPLHIAEREVKTLVRKLSLNEKHGHAYEEGRSIGPGNFAWVEVESKRVIEVISGAGEKNVSAEKVATRIAKEAQRYIESNVPIGEHLADQLVLPLAMNSGGKFLTGPLTEHTRTNIAVIQKFLDVEVYVTEPTETTRMVEIIPAS